MSETKNEVYFVDQFFTLSTVLSLLGLLVSSDREENLPQDSYLTNISGQEKVTTFWIQESL